MEDEETSGEKRKSPPEEPGSEEPPWKHRGPNKNRKSTAQPPLALTEGETTSSSSILSKKAVVEELTRTTISNETEMQKEKDSLCSKFFQIIELVAVYHTQRDKEMAATHPPLSSSTSLRNSGTSVRTRL